VIAYEKTQGQSLLDPSIKTRIKAFIFRNTSKKDGDGGGVTK